MSGPGWQPQQPEDQQYPQQPPSQPAAYPPGSQPQQPGFGPQQQAAAPGFQPQQTPAPGSHPQKPAYPPAFQQQQAPGQQPPAFPQQPLAPGFEPQQQAAAYPPGFQPQQAAPQPPQTPAPGFQAQQAAYPPGFQPQQPSQSPAPGFPQQQPPPPGFQPQQPAYPPAFQQQQAPPGFQPQQDAGQQGASFIPGFDQTGPYQQQWSPYPEQPKRKSKLPKILIITAIVLLVLAGGGWVTWRIIYVSRDEGATPISGQPNGKCAVSDGVLKGANTPVFTGGREEQNGFSCGYSIARGGSTVRTINVDIRTQANLDNFEKDLARERQGSVKPGPKIGDKSTYRAYEHDGHTYLDLYVLKGKTITKVSLYGYTKGFFGDTPAPLDQGEKDLEAVAKEVAAKN